MTIVILLYFRQPLLNLLDKFAGQNIQKAKIGPFEIEEGEKNYVEALKLLLTSFVSEDELQHLQQLYTENGAFAYTNTTQLKKELQQLKALGLIKLHTDLQQLPPEGDLKSHIELTEKGKRYLTLRQDFATDQPMTES